MSQLDSRLLFVRYKMVELICMSFTAIADVIRPI